MTGGLEIDPALQNHALGGAPYEEVDRGPHLCVRRLGDDPCGRRLEADVVVGNDHTVDGLKVCHEQRVKVVLLHAGDGRQRAQVCGLLAAHGGTAREKVREGLFGVVRVFRGEGDVEGGGSEVVGGVGGGGGLCDGGGAGLGDALDLYAGLLGDVFGGEGGMALALSWCVF